MLAVVDRHKDLSRLWASAKRSNPDCPRKLAGNRRIQDSLALVAPRNLSRPRGTLRAAPPKQAQSSAIVPCSVRVNSGPTRHRFLPRAPLLREGALPRTGAAGIQSSRRDEERVGGSGREPFASNPRKLDRREFTKKRGRAGLRFSAPYPKNSPHELGSRPHFFLFSATFSGVGCSVCTKAFTLN